MKCVTCGNCSSILENGSFECLKHGMKMSSEIAHEERKKCLWEKMCEAGEDMVEQKTEERSESHPARYCSKYECWEVLKDRLEHKQFTPFQAFLYGCAFKYMWRLGEKDELEMEIDKTENYLERFRKETKEGQK